MPEEDDKEEQSNLRSLLLFREFPFCWRGVLGLLAGLGPGRGRYKVVGWKEKKGTGTWARNLVALAVHLEINWAANMAQFWGL